MKNHLLDLYHALLDVLFPVVCASCGAGGAWLCETCVTSVRSEYGRCIHCGKRSLHGITCAPCRTDTPLFGVAAVGSYRDDTLRSAVHALKFSGVRDLAGPLGALLARKVAEALGTSLPNFTIIPLPLHPRRERSRGFNQATLLADSLGERLSLPVQHFLRRTRSTSPQTSIDARVQDSRRANVAGAFMLSVEGTDGSAPLHALLVDDVTTTGATLEEAARALYHHGARTIWGAVICRG